MLGFHFVPSQPMCWPLKTEPGETTVDGKPTQWRNGELRIDRLPEVVRAEIGH